MTFLPSNISNFMFNVFTERIFDYLMKIVYKIYENVGTVNLVILKIFNLYEGRKQM